MRGKFLKNFHWVVKKGWEGRKIPQGQLFKKPRMMLIFVELWKNRLGATYPSTNQAPSEQDISV